MQRYINTFPYATMKGVNAATISYATLARSMASLITDGYGFVSIGNQRGILLSFTNILGVNKFTLKSVAYFASTWYTSCR
jgi:hypothetical protein